MKIDETRHSEVTATDGQTTKQETSCGVSSQTHGRAKTTAVLNRPKTTPSTKSAQKSAKVASRAGHGTSTWGQACGPAAVLKMLRMSAKDKQDFIDVYRGEFIAALDRHMDRVRDIVRQLDHDALLSHQSRRGPVWVMWLIGPLPLTVCRNRYIASWVDFKTGQGNLQMLSGKNPDDIYHAFMYQIMYGNLGYVNNHTFPVGIVCPDKLVTGSRLMKQMSVLNTTLFKIPALSRMQVDPGLTANCPPSDTIGWEVLLKDFKEFPTMMHVKRSPVAVARDYIRKRRRPPHSPRPVYTKRGTLIVGGVEWQPVHAPRALQQGPPNHAPPHGVPDEVPTADAMEAAGAKEDPPPIKKRRLAKKPMEMPQLNSSHAMATRRTASIQKGEEVERSRGPVSKHIMATRQRKDNAVPPDDDDKRRSERIAERAGC